MKKHYVRLYSPGTLTAEVSVQEIESWDVEAARALAAGITERHGAIPYGFCFYTMERDGDDWEPHQSAESPMYYLPPTARWRRWRRSRRAICHPSGFCGRTCAATAGTGWL